MRHSKVVSRPSETPSHTHTANRHTLAMYTNCRDNNEADMRQYELVPWGAGVSDTSRRPQPCARTTSNTISVHPTHNTARVFVHSFPPFYPGTNTAIRQYQAYCNPSSIKATRQHMADGRISVHSHPPTQWLSGDCTAWATLLLCAAPHTTTYPGAGVPS